MNKKIKKMEDVVTIPMTKYVTTLCVQKGNLSLLKRL